jgi:RNA polymerase sigma factor (sigma-70 family)
MSAQVPAPEPIDVPLEASVELVSRAQKGDERALNDLLARYGERLRRIVRVRMGAEARRAADSMDIVQETLVVAARKLATFEPRDHASILRWLAQIAEHQITDLVERERAEKRDGRRTRSIEPADSEDLTGRIEPEGREETPSLDLSRRELEEVYDECVEELSEPQRELVLRRDYETADWETIAKETGATSTNAAKEMHRRATLRLKELLLRRLGRAFE